MIIDKYLQNYAAPESLTERASSHTWSHAVVIPVCDEPFDSVWRVTEALASAEPYLEVWVVNHPIHASAEVKQANQNLLDALIQRAGHIQPWSPCATLYQIAQRAIVAIYCPDLPLKEGVGRARKVGADLVLRLWMQGCIRAPWIWMTDADACLPVDYFHRVQDLPANTAACVYPFEHVPEGCGVQREALAAYERRLRQYAAGLQWAQSPYAFVSIGSLMVCSMTAYAQVRGIPRKSAGEDFYFLNKVAKLGRVYTLGGEPVTLSGRVSRRVPFGTGQVLAEAIDRGGETERLRGYPLILFKPLQILLDTVNASAMQAGTSAEVCLAQLRTRMESAGLSAASAEASIAQFQLLTGMKQWAHTPSPARRRAQFHEWFDGLKTLQWVHWWRAQGELGE